MQTQAGLNMGVNILVLFVLAILLHDADGCTFPSALRGTWRSSRWGDITFTSNEMTVTGLTVMGTVTFECETNSDTLYVVRSTSTVSILNNPADVMSCLDLQQLSSTKYYYYHATSEAPFISGSTEPVNLVPPSSAVNVSEACDVTSPYAIGTNHILIKSGYETAAAVQCPDPLLGTFNNYTVNKFSGTQCGGVGYIDVCSDIKNINVDLTVCSETLFYSSGGSLQCVYTSTNGSDYFVNVYNFDSTVDDSATYRFSCIAIAYGSDGMVYATQYPMACVDIQTSTSVPSSPYVGGVLQMVANMTCVPSSPEDGVNVGAIVAVVIILLLIAVVVGLAIYHLGYRKRWPLVKRKLPCLKSGQVDPQPGVGGEGEGEEEEEEETEVVSTGGLVGQPVNIATTAVGVTSHDPVQNLKPTSSSRSVLSPSKVQADLPPDGAATTTTNGSTLVAAEQPPTPLNPTPRRLPPLNPAGVPEPPSAAPDENL